jgi:mRNA deadenylase 3'-5' endonuclease subunit Ccr4
MENNLELSALPMTGFEVVPITESKWIRDQTCKFQWFVENRWTPVGHASTFVPHVHHVGQKIKLQITSNTQLGVKSLEATSKDTVILGPECGGISERQELTASFLPHPRQIRVITYNILFDGYLRRDYATDYWKCPNYVLEEAFRQQLAVKELKQYHGDLLCLQEVGPQVFTDYLQPALEASGYTGVFAPKMNDFGEGLATFYRTDKLRLLQTLSIVIRDSLISDDAFIGLCEVLKSNHEEIFQLVTTLDTVFQASVLTMGDAYFLVVNTHLYWSEPHLELVRVVQSHVILHHIEQLPKKYGFKDIGIIFCGDLNHEPSSATFHYLSKGEFQIPDISTKDQHKLSHSLSLINATGTPVYSWLTYYRQHLLDYVYSDDHFHVLQAIPVPTEDELKQDGQFVLPSCRFPSDHLALCVDLELSKN